MTDDAPESNQPAAVQARTAFDATTAQSHAERLRQRQQDLRRAQNDVHKAEGHDDRLVAAETQVLIDGEPVTVTELARQQPGETAAATAGRVAQTLQQQQDLDPRRDLSTEQSPGQGLHP